MESGYSIFLFHNNWVIEVKWQILHLFNSFLSLVNLNRKVANIDPILHFHDHTKLKSTLTIDVEVRRFQSSLAKRHLAVYHIYECVIWSVSLLKLYSLITSFLF